jgi:hypothetical protein
MVPRNRDVMLSVMGKDDGRVTALAACGHTVLPKIGPVIALLRRTDYQSPNWLSGAGVSYACSPGQHSAQVQDSGLTSRRRGSLLASALSGGRCLPERYPPAGRVSVPS